jgi:hypothetical protein
MICFTALLSEGRKSSAEFLTPAEEHFPMCTMKNTFLRFSEMNGRKSAHKNRIRLTLGCSRKSAASGKKKK